MPFTFSHPAASVPFSKKGLCLSALIVGSMVPDIDNLIPNSWWIPSHRFFGLFTFDLPVGLLILFVFHKLTKEATLSLLPDDHRTRLAALAGNFNFFPLSRFGIILLSILVGSMTHWLWDSFTHSESIFVRLFPILRTQLFEVGSIPVYMYLLFQNLSTIAGAALLILWYRQWYSKAVVTKELVNPFWTVSQRLEIVILMFGLAAAGGLGITFLYSSPSLDLRNLYYILRGSVVSGLGILLMEWLIWGGIYQLYKKVRLTR
jgi:hypothetical protein